MATPETIADFDRIQQLRCVAMNIGRDAAIRWEQTAPEQRTPIETDSAYVAARHELELAVVQFNNPDYYLLQD